MNSGGQKLLEKNFIETLLAVYDNDIHWKISQFCESARVPKDKSAYNHIIKPEPSHLIRAAVALGFDRARLKYTLGERCNPIQTHVRIGPNIRLTNRFVRTFQTEHYAELDHCWLCTRQ